jgi:hypothetical protein
MYEQEEKKSNHQQRGKCFARFKCNLRLESRPKQEILDN